MIKGGPVSIQSELTRYWNDTRKWDPFINGQMDTELEGVTDIDERKKIVNRYQWQHDIMVGQRMAVQQLRHRLAEAELR